MASQWVLYEDDSNFLVLNLRHSRPFNTSPLWKVNLIGTLCVHSESHFLQAGWLKTTPFSCITTTSTNHLTNLTNIILLRCCSINSISILGFLHLAVLSLAVLHILVLTSILDCSMPCSYIFGCSLHSSFMLGCSTHIISIPGCFRVNSYVQWYGVNVLSRFFYLFKNQYPDVLLCMCEIEFPINKVYLIWFDLILSLAVRNLARLSLQFFTH